MELFIAILMAGMIVYEFYTGEVVVQNGVRAQSRSRKSKPVTFWFTVVIQAAILVWMLLEWQGIVNVVNW